MGHHIDKKGRFQSDLHPDLAPDKIILSFKDPAARVALSAFAIVTEDKELGDDVDQRLQELAEPDDARPWMKLIIELIPQAASLLQAFSDHTYGEEDENDD